MLVGFLIAGFLLLVATFSLRFFLSDLFFALFLASGCSDQVVSETPSPNGKLKAVLYVRDCGATTRAVTILTILPAAQDKPSYGSPRVLAGYEVPWNAETHQIGCRWLGDRSLKAYYTPEVELTNLDSHVEGVTVTYEIRLPDRQE